MATQIGEAVIRLTFDGKEVKASLDKTETQIESSGKKSGSAFGNAWSVAAGSLISKGISKITATISSSLGAAIKRVDTLANSQKVFTAMGYAADDVSKSMEGLTEYLNDLPTSMTTAVSAVQALSASFGRIDLGTQAFIDLNNAGLAFGATTEQIENAIAQLGQLSLDGPLDAQTWNSLRNSGFGPVFTAMAKDANKTVGELKASFGSGELSVQDFMDRLHKLNTEGGGDMESLADLARTNTTGIGTAIENVQNRIVKAISKIIDHIGQEKISQAINNISEGFTKVADVVINIIDFLSANQWILEFVGTFVGVLTAISVAMWAVNAAMMASPITWIVLGISAIVAGIILLITHIKEVGQFFQSVFGGVAEFLGGICQTIGDFFVGLWEGFKAGVQGAWDFITGIFGNLASFFGSIFSSAWEAVKAVFSTGGQIFMGIVDGITSAFRTIVNAIITGINHVVALPFNAINGFLSFLKGIDILGVKPFDWVGTIDVPQIPLLAQGGVVSGATAAVIGEEGTEAVLPLENNTDNWAGTLASILTEKMAEDGTTGAGGTINVYMTNEINNELDAQEIGRIMMQSIRRAA